MKNILKMLDCDPRSLMRKGESEYKQLSLNNENLSDDKLIEAMLKNPILIERPIVVTKNKAAIGRPPENILEIL